MGAWMKGRNSRHSKIHTKGAAATPLNTLDCWWHFVNFLSICISISELILHHSYAAKTARAAMAQDILRWVRTAGFWRLCLDSRSTLDRRQSHGCQPRAQFRSKYTTENHHIYKILIDINRYYRIIKAHTFLLLHFDSTCKPKRHASFEQTPKYQLCTRHDGPHAYIHLAQVSLACGCLDTRQEEQVFN